MGHGAWGKNEKIRKEFRKEPLTPKTLRLGSWVLGYTFVADCALSLVP
jgi:hypothetical protein